MPRSSRVRNYFIELSSVSPLSLALFRICFGLVCFVDLLRRLPKLTLFYTNDGLLSNHYALYSNGVLPQFSLLYAFSSYPEVLAFFLLTLASLLCFILGYKTRLFRTLSFLGVLSIINRCRFAMYGGDSVIIAFFLFSFFLPLDLCLAVTPSPAAGPLVPSKIKGSQPTYSSVAILGFLLQIAAIYLVTALAKNGPGWREGNIIHYFLHQDRIVTNLGIWVREHVPYVCLQGLCYGALLMEFTIPFLIFSPFKKRLCRRVAALFIFSLHMGIALLGTLGVFSFVMLCSIPLLLCAKDIEGVLRKWKIPTKFLTLLPSFQTTKRPLHWLRHVLATVFVLTAGALTLEANSVTQNIFKIQLPNGVHRLCDYIGFFEAWQMFAPDMTHEDFRLVMDVELEDGTHIDPQNGLAPDFSPEGASLIEWDQLWDAYSSQIWRPRWNGHRTELDRWMKTRRKGLHFPQVDAIKSYKVHLLRTQIPPPGSALNAKPKLIETVVLFEGTGS